MEPDFVLTGCLRRDYLLPFAGQPLIDIPGGNMLYAAAGLTVWKGPVGLVGRVGEDYPHGWLRLFQACGWDTDGIRILAEHLDLRYFQASTDLHTFHLNNPVAHFSRLGLPFPKALLGYQPVKEPVDDRKIPQLTSPRPVDVPAGYLLARAVHLCPMDYATHNRMLTTFRQAGVTTLTLDPSPAYINAITLDEIRALLNGLTAFQVAETQIRKLFWGKTDDLWQMIESLASFGCELILVRRAGGGTLLYDRAGQKRWEIPAYPVRLVDLMGVGDAFCGGFLAGYYQAYDPLHAALCGTVSASMVAEGIGVFHAPEAAPGLAQARLESLAGMVRSV
ncbi:MAG: PfkB family carbohydrate kinase [Chloroflexota bacterium]